MLSLICDFRLNILFFMTFAEWLKTYDCKTLIINCFCIFKFHCLIHEIVLKYRME